MPIEKMTFKEAANTEMPFGKFKGKTLDKIAETDEGLKYLDWLFGQDFVRAPLKVALKTYLHDETIAKELDRAQDRRAPATMGDYEDDAGDVDDVPF